MTNILELGGNVVTSSMKDKIFLFYGAPGTWKTTVATGNKDTTLLLAYEIGYKMIPGVRALNLTNWHGIKDAVRQLRNAEAKEQYDTVVIDTISLAYKACTDYICAREGVTAIGKIPYGQGYGMAKDEFEKVMHSIPQMGYGLIMIAHSDESMDEEAGTTVRVDINKRPAGVIKGMADFILYARKEPRDEKDGEGMGVYAYSETANPNIEVKSRARFFPKRFFFTYEELKKGLEGAIMEQDGFFGVESTDEANFDAYKETVIDVKPLQEEVTHLAQKLMKTTASQEVGEILTEELKGVRVSETTQAHVPALHSSLERLILLESKL